MRLIAALLALALVSTGCATTTGRNAGAACALGSTLLLGTILQGQNQPPSDSEAPPLSVYIAAAAIAIALVSGGIAIGAEVTAPASIEPPTPSGPPHACDPRAEQLTHEAQQAAHLGQCGAVSSFGRRVRDIDPGCYAVEFVAIHCDPSTSP